MEGKQHSKKLLLAAFAAILTISGFVVFMAMAPDEVQTEGEKMQDQNVNTLRTYDDPAYSGNGNGEIDYFEVINAVQDYFDDIITKEQALDVIQLYFG